MPELSRWIPAHETNGVDIESSSLLGPFFALSPLAPDIAHELFTKVNTKFDKFITSSSIQKEAREYQHYLYEVCKIIIKSSESGKRGVLDWFSAALSRNKQRRQSRTDLTTVASDGFIYNLVAVLNLFAEPLTLSKKNIVPIIV